MPRRRTPGCSSQAYSHNKCWQYDDTTGAFEGVFAQGGGLNGPLGLAFGPGGDLFVASSNTEQVLRYDGTTVRFKVSSPPAAGWPTQPAWRSAPAATCLS